MNIKPGENRPWEVSKISEESNSQNHTGSTDAIARLFNRNKQEDSEQIKDDSFQDYNRFEIITDKQGTLWKRVLPPEHEAKPIGPDDWFFAETDENIKKQRKFIHPDDYK